MDLQSVARYVTGMQMFFGSLCRVNISQHNINAQYSFPSTKDSYQLFISIFIPSQRDSAS